MQKKIKYNPSFKGCINFSCHFGWETTNKLCYNSCETIQIKLEVKNKHKFFSVHWMGGYKLQAERASPTLFMV